MTNKGKTLVVTRHAGALEWLERRGVHGEIVPHLRLEDVASGDTIVGTLPIHLAAEVIAKGADYYHLVVNMPAEARGAELTADDMERFGARLWRVADLRMEES